MRDYDPRWPGVFEALNETVLAALGELVVSVEHVGSTSVSGLAAKPVIDLDVVVASADVATAIERLATIGYEHLGDRGIPQREAFDSPAGSPRHHLYLCPVGSPALANHLAVRNHLRENPAAAAEYGMLKKRLAREHANDSASYGEAKTEFLVAILRGLGFAQDALADIESMNRAPEAG